MTSDNYSDQLEDLIIQYKTDNPCQIKLDNELVMYNQILRKELKRFYITYRVPDDDSTDTYFNLFWTKTMLYHLIELEDSNLTKDMIGFSFINQFSNQLLDCTIFYKGQLFNL